MCALYCTKYDCFVDVVCHSHVADMRMLQGWD